MHNLLYKLLNKRRIESVDELSVDEKTVFENWNKVLTTEDLTVNEIKVFCQGQIDIIETKWKDYGLEQAKKNELLPYYTVYKTLLAVIDSPKTAREALENYLIQLINQ